MKILLAVDGSVYSERAVRYVIHLAQECANIEVTLTTVVPPSDAWELKRFMKPEEIEAMQESQGGDALALARTLLDAANVRYQPQVLLGPVAKTLVRHAEEWSAGQIVMGSHGHGAAEGTVLGSVALNVIHLASMPVTVVK